MHIPSTPCTQAYRMHNSTSSRFRLVPSRITMSWVFILQALWWLLDYAVKICLNFFPPHSFPFGLIFCILRAKVCREHWKVCFLSKIKHRTYLWYLIYTWEFFFGHDKAETNDPLHAFPGDSSPTHSNAEIPFFCLNIWPENWANLTMPRSVWWTSHLSKKLRPLLDK